VGLGPDGTFSLDLVADGPHALIGGTSGAGKSELLQSMVASLISCHPPNRLNLLFVDYKGGASSTVFRDVPHTVGYVTNLDASLSMRALTSLRAELDRRMRLLEGKAKDLAEMLERDPDEAPPSLVIVVDEFATLVKEIPEFVAGIVDIAQRGRSLGIHLVLATQRPSGSVNDNILANTNLRIALRMLDNAESGSVIGSPEAASIPVPLRGRGFARLGPTQLVPFQTAFAGAPLEGGAQRPVVVRSFETTGVGAPLALSTPGSEQPTAELAASEPRTHLDAVLDAVVEAYERSGLPASRPPWREMLPDHITLDELAADPRYEIAPEDAGRVVALGQLDAPEDQDQYPALVDLEDGGGLLVFGAGGSGKTTLLRTAVLSAVRAAEPGGLAVFGIDFASRALKNLEALPEVPAVAGGDDLEGVTRIIALLGAELERRRTLLAEARAETLSAYRAQGGDAAGSLPRILLVVDGYANLVASMTGASFASNLDEWLQDLHRVVIDGRQVGIHTVLAAERRAGVPALIQSAVAHRLVLRQADPAGYAELGIPLATASGLDLEPGRGLWRGARLVQVACISPDGDGRAQAEAVLAEAERRAGRPSPVRTEPLPAVVAADALPAPAEGRVPVGVADLTLDPVWVDVEHTHVLVTGVPRSGRSTAARVVADGLEAAGYEVWKLGRQGSPLAEGADLHRSAFGRPAGIQPVLEELAELLDSSPTAVPRVLVVDDLDTLEDPGLNPLWERLAGHDAVRVVATIENRSFSGFSMNALLNEVRGARRLLVLRPDDPMELFQMTGVKAQIRPGTPMPPGRGVLLADRIPTLVQVAEPAAPKQPAEHRRNP
jgi:DNA segregation ATPase FtsK/SpoIIIE, S-DNA-T family